MEPDGNKPNDVEHGVNGLLEGEGYQAGAVVGGVVAGNEGIAAIGKFGKHHVVPEIVEVEQQADHDNKAEHEHVL